MSRLRVKRVWEADREALGPRIAALEQQATYPIGEDFFQIDHGPDYFAFFDRLGQTHYYVVLDDERVVAVACGILRRLPFVQGGQPLRTWYLSDLKVHPDYRRRHIPLQMLRYGICPHYLRCPRGYAITMNPGDGRPNPVVRLLEHWRWTPIRVVGILELWSLDAAQMTAVAPLVEEHRGGLSYLSLAGVKDIVLQSTGQPMPLLHVSFDPAEGQHQAPQPGHVHMVCALTDDPLNHALRGAGFQPGATATLVAHGMRRSDWRFVLTSEI